LNNLFNPGELFVVLSGFGFGGHMGEKAGFIARPDITCYYSPLPALAFTAMH
jgi:hypothetical protein